MKLTETKLLAFDADDTLWDCQSFFDDISRRYCEFLAHYGNIDAIGEALFKVEMGNMEELGYGTKAFVISLVENALRISDYRLDAHETEEIVRLGRSLLRLPATPFPGVTETLQKLKAQDGYTMVVLTKGDYLEQERKFHRSGLKEFFDDFIVSKATFILPCRLVVKPSIYHITPLGSTNMPNLSNTNSSSPSKSSTNSGNCWVHKENRYTHKTTQHKKNCIWQNTKKEANAPTNDK